LNQNRVYKFCFPLGTSDNKLPNDSVQLLFDWLTKLQDRFREELREDEDPREPLLEIAHKINTQLSIIRKLIKAQRQGTRSKNNRYPGSTPEKQAPNMIASDSSRVEIPKENMTIRNYIQAN
jgi:hypothetical protein